MTRLTVAAVAASTLVTTVTAAEPVEFPRTQWGVPDLQGVWDFRTITPLQRPEELENREFLTKAEAVMLESRVDRRNRRSWEASAWRTEAGGSVGEHNLFWMDRGTRVVETDRTSLIVDPPNGRLPRLTKEGLHRAQVRRAYQANHPADSSTDRNPYERCLIGFNQGPPMLPGAYNNNVQIFQTPDHVVILNEMVHDARIIPLDGRSRLGLDPWTGESRGWWDGDTLVVETINFNSRHAWRAASPDRHLVERFTRVAENTLLYEFTVTDPKTWAAPWTAQLPMKLNELPLFEYACHEGNYSLEHILRGARSDEPRLH